MLFAAVLTSVISIAGFYAISYHGVRPQDASALGPSSPYVLYGYAYDSNFNAVGSANITVLDLITADAGQAVADVNGYYQFNLANLPNGYSLGDTITITGNMTELIGYNSTTVTGSGGKWFNVTMSVVIPEFSSLVVPVVGMMLIVSLAPAIRQRVFKKRDNSVR
jgi:hypothetical protein